MRFTETDAMTSALEAFTTADPEPQLDGAGDRPARRDRRPRPGAGRLRRRDRRRVERWVDETDIDGFNLAYAVTPESFVDFVDLVVPELQRRGVYKRDYAPGTLREKLFGSGRARLPANHPAARTRPVSSSRL